MRRVVAIACAIAGGVGLLVVGTAASDDGGSYKVRAIFDNASFLVQGEDVRVAGATVGQVAEVDVTQPDETVRLEDGPEDEPGKAAIVLNIDNAGFQDFREDASCIIRPQSTLGEKFVECRPTQPRAPGSEPPPPLEQIPEGQPGEGEYLLPLENNGKAVDLDLINNIMRRPYADRFRLILNDLGAGLAARGDELEEIVERANPALRETNRVLAILREQNRTLAQLARESDTVLEPLARERRAITGFMRGSNEAAQATAERADELEAGWERFPAFLRELRQTSVELRRFSDAGTPVITDFGKAAPDVTRAQRALAPLSKASTEALITLGDAAEESEDDIVASDPVITDVRDLARSAKPGANQLDRLFSSLDERLCVQRDLATGECTSTTTGLSSLMDFIFGTSASVNGFDSFGHYLRTFGLVTTCTEITVQVLGECDARFGTGSELNSGAARVAAAEDDSEKRPRRVKRRGHRAAENAPEADAPEADAPEADAPSGDEGESSDVPSLRAGKELLRFLMEDR